MKKSLHLLLAALLVTVGACNDDPLFEIPPEAPTTVAAAVQGTSATITWTPGAGATSQEVRLSPVVPVPLSQGTALLVEDDHVQTFADNTTSSALFENLTQGTTYSATVTAINGSSRTSSEPISVQIAGSGTAPVITSVALDENDPTTLIVEWTAVEGAENYQVSLTADDATGDFQEIAGAAATSFPFSPVNPGTTYTAEVCLFTQGGGVGECGSTVDFMVPEPSVVSFATDILPYFDTSCNSCHGAAALGGIRLDSYTEVSTGSNANGPLIVAGDSNDATAILLPKVEADHNNGPDDAAFAVDLAAWIDAGADDN